jgi:hypothetical protein
LTTAVVRLEGLGQLKNAVCSPGIEPTTFCCRIVPQPAVPPRAPNNNNDDFIIKLLLQGEDGMGGAGLGGSGFEFGVDPNEDPELALVSSKIFSHMFRKYRDKKLGTVVELQIFVFVAYRDVLFHELDIFLL